MKKIVVAIASLMLLAIVLPAYETENTPAEAKYYDNAKVIRIKNVEGEGFVQRSYEEGYEEATPNLPIFEKDSVGTTAGRLGIYLGRLNYLRLDSDTQVGLLSIPELRETNLVARVEKGAIYLDIENLDKEKSIEIQTADCGIFLLDKGIYRINVDENSMTEVYVIEGIAEVAGQDDSRNVRENQKIVMSRGKLEERPYYFYASEKDDFDRWNETQNREQGYARYNTSRYLQNGYEDYEYEMSRSGRWSYMSQFNSYVWTPFYGNADWMPYANGRWVYNPFYGYVWTSYDDCGWFTHHYGRWHWDYGSGWYWIPAYHWSPAWVSWFGDNDYYGWCPLSWWNRPVIIVNRHWDHNYNYRRGIPRDSRSTIIIRKNELTAFNAKRVALGRSSIGQASGSLIAYRGTAPVERPSITRVSVINARGKTMEFKQNTIVASEKYRISKETEQTSHGSALKSTLYKYNPPSDAASRYAPRVYRAKEVEKQTEAGSDGSFRSKTGGESSGGTSVRSSGSSSSRDKSESKATSSGKSTRSSNSSSSTSSSSQTAKKKRNGEAYAELLRSENNAGYKSHATGITASSSGYASAGSNNDRYSFGHHGSGSGGESGAAAEHTAVSSMRFTGSGETAPTRPNPFQNGYASRSNPAATNYEAKELARSQNFSYAGQKNAGFSAMSSHRGNDGGNANSTSNPSVRSLTPSRSQNYSRPSFSTPVRSTESSVVSASHSSSSAASTAKKREH
jgi:hypothetical protein